MVILYVDPDPAVRSRRAEMLAHCGHTVHEADGAEAAAILAQQLKPLEVLVTEGVLGGDFTGFDLRDAVRAKFPALRTVVTSRFDLAEWSAFVEDSTVLCEPVADEALAASVAGDAPPAAAVIDEEPAATDTAPLLAPGTALGNYVIKERLYSEPDSETYLALQQAVKREVALVLLKPELLNDAAVVAGFLERSRVKAAITHPRIAPLYEGLGFDIVEGKRSADRVALHEGPHWQNCGYWAGPTTYAQACAALAQLVGELAELDDAEDALDVGFGFGEQNLYWASHFGFARMSGVNITPFQVEFARERAAAAGLAGRLTFSVGDAVRLNEADASMDRILALQSAFQFNTRAVFFAEAARVLRPGGTLVLADMIVRQGGVAGRSPWAWFTRRRVGWPHANVYDAQRYTQLLRQAGFHDITIKSIAEHVFPGMQQYIARRYAGEPSEAITVYPRDCQPIDQASRLWFAHYGVDDYVLVRAVKNVGG